MNLWFVYWRLLKTLWIKQHLLEKPHRHIHDKRQANRNGVVKRGSSSPGQGCTHKHCIHFKGVPLQQSHLTRYRKQNSNADLISEYRISTLANQIYLSHERGVNKIIVIRIIDDIELKGWWMEEWIMRIII